MSKGYPMGEEHVGMWNVYASPFDLETYSVLEMERFIFHSHGLWVTTMNCLREQISTGDIYIFSLIILKNMKWIWRRCEVNHGDLCTNRYRKGVAIIIPHDCTDSATITSLCTRCGWSMENKYVVHCVSNIIQNSTLFVWSHIYLVFILLKIYRQILIRDRWIYGWNKFIQ